MRPCAVPPIVIRGAELGGARPLICVPVAAGDPEGLLEQATLARALAPDVVEWRADSFDDLTQGAVCRAAQALRRVLDRQPIIFTLRLVEEGGAKPLAQAARSGIIQAVLRSGLVDIVDIELVNGAAFIDPLTSLARRHGSKVILSFHDFEGTPGNETLLAQISEMVRQGGDIAKVACVPRDPGDVLRLLQVTLTARRMFPAVPLCTMSMGNMGLATRVAGFLFGSDMTFAAGKAVSAPGQIPVGELRPMIEALLLRA